MKDSRTWLKEAQADPPSEELPLDTESFTVRKALLNERRDAAIYSRKMRDFIYMWENYEPEEVVGPLNEETRLRAVEMLVRAQKVLGGTRRDVGRFLSVGLNFKMRPLKGKWSYASMVRYELVYELYLHAPYMFSKKYANSKLSKAKGVDRRLVRDKGTVIKDARNGTYMDVLLGTIVEASLDMHTSTGHIRVGSAETDDLFDVTFSLDTETLREDEESAKVMQWLNKRIVNDMDRD